MKVVLSIICWLFVALCCYFTFAYNHNEMDKMELKISHILVDTEEQALEIKKEITENKKSFGEMAEKYSQCPSSKDKGDIGYNMRNKLIKEFEVAAFKLNKNEISEPVKTSEGWHLIKVTDAKYFSDKENFSRRYF